MRWDKFCILGQLSGCYVSWKRRLVCIALPFNFVIYCGTPLTSDKQEGLFVVSFFSRIRQLPVGGFGPLSEQASFSGNNEPNIDFYFMNPAPLSSCNGRLALLHRFLYQLPDYTVVVNPKEGVKRECGGGEGKVPVLTATLMASIWVFGEKHLWILQLKLLSTVCCCFWHNHWCIRPILAISFSTLGVIGSLYVVLSWAGWSGFDWPTSK